MHAALPSNAAGQGKPAARWYTPSLEGNTPFPATPASIPTPSVSTPPPAEKKPKTRLMIVLAVGLTVLLVVAAIVASYLAPQ
jgi:hypothetical protein